MIYLKKFDSHASYETEINGGGVDISLPNVSYCKDVKDVHYTPYNLVRFYVGEITGTTHQTVKIYTNRTTSIPIQVSEGNKWYSYLLPKDKGLYKIESGYYDSNEDEWSNGIVTKAIIKADINITRDNIIPYSTVEASFKGSNTSNVTDMTYMFYNRSGLTSLDVSSFDTINVTDMTYMFSNCSSLTSLDVSSFNTSNVTDMPSMFSSCGSLTSLDLSGWDTSNVTDMNSMFYGCSGLTSLDLRNFNTSNVTKMYYMFNGCNGLTSLDLSGWDMSNVTSMDSMFEGCSNLHSIRMAGCNQTTINKIKAVKPSSASISTV